MTEVAKVHFSPWRIRLVWLVGVLTLRRLPEPLAERLARWAVANMWVEFREE